MRTNENRDLLLQAAARTAIGALLLLTMVLMGVAMARAAEIIPSIGITRAVDDNSGNAAKTFGGLAVRGHTPLAEGVEVFLAVDPVAVAPVTPASWRHLQLQAVAVIEPVSLGFRLGGLDAGICQRHGGSRSGYRMVDTRVCTRFLTGCHWKALAYAE